MPPLKHRGQFLLVRFLAPGGGHQTLVSSQLQPLHARHSPPGLGLLFSYQDTVPMDEDRP